MAKDITEASTDKGFVPETLDDFIQFTQDFNTKERAVGNVLYGLRHDKTPIILPENKDDYGYVFFTRPQLNLSRLNIRNHRTFFDLLTKNKETIHNYVRNTLDPRLYKPGSGHPLVDPENVFIPVLTNTLTKMSGWPDRVAPTWSSDEGLRREQYTMVDGTTEVNGVFDLDATFRVFAGEPITMLLEKWVTYQSLVFEGVFNPYLDYIVENTIDYNTRIYRLVMDSEGRYVKKIAATGAAFPINDNSGQAFDYTHDIPYNDQNKEVTLRFKAMGAIYNDPILIFAFNRAVGTFHAGMRAVNNGGASDMVPIPRDILPVARYRGYPRINPETLELQWYIKASELEAFTKIKINVRGE